MKANINSLFTALLIVIAQQATCQYKILVQDSLTLEGIPFTHIISNDGRLIALTDQHGYYEISDQNLAEFIANSPIKFQHISYEPAFLIPKMEADGNPTVKMGPLKLEPVHIMGKQIAKKDGYILLKGYFRSFHLNDDTPKYYSDGFIEYVFPLESNQKKLAKINTLEHRTFKNEVLRNADKQRGFNVQMDSFGPPFLYNIPTIKDLMGDFVIEEKQGQCEILDKNIKIGNIHSDSVNFTATLSVDINFNTKENIRRAFGYESRFERKAFTEVFSPSQSDLKKNSYENLIRVSQYRKVHFKHKSEEKFQVIEWVTEFYVMERSYLDKTELSDFQIKEYSAIQYASDFKEDYLIRVSQLNIPDFPQLVLQTLNTQLILSKE